MSTIIGNIEAILGLNARDFVKGVGDAVGANTRLEQSINDASAAVVKHTQVTEQATKQQTAAVNRAAQQQGEAAKLAARISAQATAQQVQQETATRQNAERLMQQHYTNVARMNRAAKVQNVGEDKRAAQQSASFSIEQAKRAARQIEREHRAALARIREDYARGFGNPKAGIAAAGAQRNAALLSVIDKGGAAGTFAGAEGQAAYVALAGKLRDVDKAAKGARVTMNTLRSGMTTVASSALSTIPGVTQLSSALGAMALGSGIMIGVMAGIAALAFAWKALTKDMKAASEQAEANIGVLQRLMQASRDTLGHDIDRGLVEAEAKVKKLEARLAVISATRFTREGAALPRDEKAIARLRADIAEQTALIARGEAAKAKIVKEAIGQNQEAWESANKATRKSQDEQLRDLKTFADDYVEQLKRIEDSIRGVQMPRLLPKFDSPSESEARFRVARGVPVTSETTTRDIKNAEFTGFVLDPLKDLGKVLATTTAQVDEFGKTAGQARDAFGGTVFGPDGKPLTRPPADTGLFNGVGGRVKDMLNPSTILNNVAGNLATGGINMAIGAVGKFADSLFDFSGKARKAAEEAKKAHDAFSRSMNDAIDSLVGALPDQFLGARSTVVSQFTDINERLGVRGAMGEMAGINALAGQQDFGSLIKTIEAIRAGSRAAGDTGYEYAELTKLLEYARAAQEAYNKALAEARTAAREDNNVLRLRAEGMDKEAEAAALALERARELAGIKDEELRAIVAEGHALQDLIDARRKEAEAAEQAAENALKLAEFSANLAARQAAQAGDDVEAARLRAQFAADQELAAARKLVEAGVITEEMFKALAVVIGQDVADAIANAERAIADAVQSLNDSLSFAEFEQAGNDAAAAALRANRQAEAWRKEAEKLGQGQDVFDRINAWLTTELARIATGGAAGGAVAADSAARTAATVASVTSITSMQAIRLIDISRSQLAVQQEMAASLRGMTYSTTRGDSGAARPMAGNVTVEFGDVVIQAGTIVADDQGIRQLARRMATELDIVFGDKFERRRRGTGINTVN